MTDEELLRVIGVPPDSPTRLAYLAIARAVEAAALERALRTINAVRMDDGKAGQHRAWYGGIDDCAAAIRAMIPKAQGARDDQ